MVNRRHIRIKVMQSVYAVLQSKNDNLDSEEKFLLYSIRKVYELYVLQLLLLVEVRNMAIEHTEIKKKKHLATSEDKNPNLNFIHNKVIDSIANSVELNEFASKRKLDNWNENREYVRVIWDEIQKSKLYDDIIKHGSTSFKEDKIFILEIFEKIIAPNDKLYDYYDSLNLGWVDDLPFVNTSILKLLKKLKSGVNIPFDRVGLKRDDQDFMINLFRITINHQTEYDQEINDKTPNWDTDRIAAIDLILIKMAITEFLHFESIPTKVTINEYIEVSKDYSTKKSSYFINGVLDKVLKDYHKSDRLNKIGRGLL